MAKPQSSFPDDAARRGAPRGFRIPGRNLKITAAAGSRGPPPGDIITMPGCPKNPAAENIDVDENGRITGLF